MSLDWSYLTVHLFYANEGDQLLTKLHIPCEFQENVDLGELMFSLCYLPTAGRLTITMIKARNLKAMDITGASGGF